MINMLKKENLNLQAELAKVKEKLKIAIDSAWVHKSQITMEILIFENTPFREIPEQDNPYYDKEDATECLVISRMPDYISVFEVSHISKDKNLTV